MWLYKFAAELKPILFWSFMSTNSFNQALLWVESWKDTSCLSMPSTWSRYKQWLISYLHVTHRKFGLPANTMQKIGKLSYVHNYSYKILGWNVLWLTVSNKMHFQVKILKKNLPFFKICTIQIADRYSFTSHEFWNPLTLVKRLSNCFYWSMFSRFWKYIYIYIIQFSLGHRFKIFF